MSARMRNQRLVALFAAGWALLNFPLLTLWDRPLTLAGSRCCRWRCLSAGRC